MKSLLSKLYSSLFFRERTFCPVCGCSGLNFEPLSSYYRDQAVKYGYTYFGKGEMIAIDTYSCVKCGASDRERLCAFWIERQIKMGKLTRGMRAIHFAPEKNLSVKLRNQWLDNYETADLVMEDCDHKADMMNMPFTDESFSFFICNHVLEHVDSDDKAIAELYRITKKDGCGILLAPICMDLKHTLEDPLITEEEDRWRHFGQGDHVRLYAHDDYVAKISQYGFVVRELGVKHFGEAMFKSLGLKKTSILYVLTK